VALVRFLNLNHSSTAEGSTIKFPPLSASTNTSTPACRYNPNIFGIPGTTSPSTTTRNVAGTFDSYTDANAGFPTRGAPNVYTSIFPPLLGERQGKLILKS